MSICGKDGGIAPIAPGPLSSQMLSFSVDISATSFEPAPTSFIKFIEKSAQRLQQVESTTKKATKKVAKKATRKKAATEAAPTEATPAKAKKK